jgi:hypothetical protein
MIHEVEVSNLMFNKISDEQKNFNKYNINVELEEESSNDEKTVLKYSLDLTSNPKNAVINISGSTTLSGEPSEIEKFLKQEDEKTPEVVSLIYQELFPLMYIISKNMKIPSPAHTISLNISGESEDRFEKSEEDNEKSPETPKESSDEKVEESSDEKVEESSDEKVEESSDEKVEESSDEKIDETNKPMKESQEAEIKKDEESDVPEKQNNENES